MNIIPIIGIGLIGTVLALTLKPIKPEAAMIVALATGTIIFLILVRHLSVIITLFTTLSNNAGIDFAFIEIILKIVGVAYIVQLASNTATDSGQSAIAAKIDLSGKLCIMLLSLPILLSLVETITGLMRQ
ncbi:MAG: stage III sporulation protein AD [Clostridiales bacterium]|jgi:stage III sporulation protein AD|nr:stage III sporulation protein AD [Clostridiales bacterium]